MLLHLTFCVSVRQKRIVIDERLALAQAMNMKVKAMDALKVFQLANLWRLTIFNANCNAHSSILFFIHDYKKIQI